MATVVGVDARQKEGLWAVWIEDGQLTGIQQLADVPTLLEEATHAVVIAVDIPIGHDDPEGAGDGWRACDLEGRRLLGDEAAERLLPFPPPAIYEASTLHEAQALCESEGWPELAPPMWYGRERVRAFTQAAGRDARVVEVHPEVSFTRLHQMHGAEGPLEHYGRGWNALYERLELLHEAGLRPSRSMGGVGRASPKDVIDATIVAWSANRVARGENELLPSEPPMEPRTDRPVAFHV